MKIGIRKIPRLRLLAGLLVVGALLMALLPTPVLAAVHPMVVYGDVELDGDPAPVDPTTTIKIYLDSVLMETTTVTTEGQYGPVQIWADEADHGKVFTFTVNDFAATSDPAAPVFGWENQEVDLTAESGPPPTRYTLTVTINPLGGGVVNLDPAQPVDGYVEDTVVQLTAVPAADYSFANWTGHLTGSANPTNISMTSDKNVTANFTPPPPPGEFHKWLGEGWNYMSTPVKLASTLGDIVQGDFVAYRLYAPNQTWYPVGTTYVLNPLEAIAIQVDTTTELVFVASSGPPSAPPTRQLYAGMNLIGPAPAYDPGIEDFPSIPVDRVLISIAPSYTTVASPALNQAGWTYIIGAGTVPLVQSYKGCFVFLTVAKVLAGESTTPLTP